MSRYDRLIPVPLVSNAVACEVFARWAAARGMKRFGESAYISARNPSEDRVYFAEVDASSPIKVGWSKNPARRVKELRLDGRTLRPVVALADFGNVDELYLHSIFKPFLVGDLSKELYRRDTPVASLMSEFLAAADACCIERFCAATPRVSAGKAA